MNATLLTVDIRREHDVVLARQRARQLASFVGLDVREQTRFATAVSEIARNAFQYGRGGRAEFSLVTNGAPALVVRIADQGPGIADLEAVLDGRYVSPTGMGLGITGARRLTDFFEITSDEASGTSIRLGKHLPPKPELFSGAVLRGIAAELARLASQDPAVEIQHQNRELLLVLQEVQLRQAEVERLNRELEETNRGVLALYAALDEKAQDLARVSELKSRFLSNMSHELRTPLNAVRNICRLLLDRLDGPLSDEQERQVRLIEGAAGSLANMVSDLLDIAKIEAGRTIVRPTPTSPAELFAALRGMVRPLATSDAVALVFDDVSTLPPLFTDEGKLAQILRNVVVNALKFTEQGEVRIGALAAPEGYVTFTVTDTGIGIAPDDQARIFDEFSQLDSPLQARVVGTGLGLPLSRKLAELLGGRLSLRSTPGVGSCFSVVIPLSYDEHLAAGVPHGASFEVQHV